MSGRAVSQAVLYSMLMVGVFSPAHALTQQELVAKLESAGYSQIRETPIRHSGSTLGGWSALCSALPTDI
jgi:hypothetical protein